MKAYLLGALLLVALAVGLAVAVTRMFEAQTMRRDAAIAAEACPKGATAPKKGCPERAP